VTTRFQSAAIIGTGLLGASLGLALKERRLAEVVHGVGRRQSSLDIALERGAIDHGHLDVEAAIQTADLIVICTPAGSVPAMLDLVLKSAKPNAIVTDVTSTKRTICTHAAHTWPTPRRFIGSHPMAGSENFGPEHAVSDLYDGRYVLVESGAGLDDAAHLAVIALWEAVGAIVSDIDPAEHDRLLARTSHVPHIASAAIAMLTHGESDLRPFAGGGFKDITRVAAGRPELWRDICLTNSDSVSKTLDDLMSVLQQFKDAVAQKDTDQLDRLFEDGRQARLDVFDQDAGDAS